MCDFIGFKDNKLNYRCKECKKTFTKSIYRLIKKFPRMYQFCNGDLDKLVLLLRKGVYPYEYVDSWERFGETSLPDKKYFYSELILEDITYKNYAHAQNVWEIFEMNSLGEYHDLYGQRDTLLLADIFEKFRDTCIEICGLDPSHILSAPVLAWQACLKKTYRELELLTDAHILLIIEKGVRGGMCQSTHRYAQANNK